MELTSMEINRLALWGYLGYARLGKNTIRKHRMQRGTDSPHRIHTGTLFTHIMISTSISSHVGSLLRKEQAPYHSHTTVHLRLPQKGQQAMKAAVINPHCTPSH